MRFRIQKYQKGYVVEVEQITGLIFKRKRWVHFVSVAGMPDEPWYHSSFDYAMMNLLDEVRWQTLRDSPTSSAN